jgi:hypothetical protein
MKGRRGSGFIESAERFSISPRSYTNSIKIKIFKYAFIVASVFMSLIAFTAVYLGPTRFSAEVNEVFGMQQGCSQTALGPSSSASAAGSLPGEDSIFELKTKVAALEQALEHSRAVAAAAKPHSALDLDRVAILGERNTQVFSKFLKSHPSQPSAPFPAKNSYFSLFFFSLYRGTNPVEHILRTNLRPEEIAIQPGLRNIKHYFQDPDDSLTRTLILIVVRNPYDWLTSMHISCYCCEDVHEKSLEEFLKMPFQTTLVDPVTKDTRPTEGCPLDYNKFQNLKKSGSSGENSKSKSFKNVMSARYEKFHHWSNFSRTAAGYEIVQIEDLLDPGKQESWFMALAKKWHLPVSLKTDGFEPLVKDARFWRVEGEENYFQVEKRVAKSIYLDFEASEKLLASDAGVRRECRLKNLYFDDFVEDMMGYHRVDCEAGRKKKQDTEKKEKEKEKEGEGSGSAQVTR